MFVQYIKCAKLEVIQRRSEKSRFNLCGGGQTSREPFTGHFRSVDGKTFQILPNMKSIMHACSMWSWDARQQNWDHYWMYTHVGSLRRVFREQPVTTPRGLVRFLTCMKPIQHLWLTSNVHVRSTFGVSTRSTLRQTQRKGSCCDPFGCMSACVWVGGQTSREPFTGHFRSVYV